MSKNNWEQDLNMTFSSQTINSLIKSAQRMGVSMKTCISLLIIGTLLPRDLLEYIPRLLTVVGAVMNLRLIFIICGADIGRSLIFCIWCTEQFMKYFE